VAAGEPLGFGQSVVRMNGHAIEFRIYAESPARGFVPTTGPILKLRLPDGARVDSGITEGAAVTAAFDPMLAKIIVHGTDRENARARARDALSKFVLLGCETNTDFLRRLVDHRAFANGEIHTGFLDAHPEIAAEPPLPDALRDRLLAIAALSLRPLRDAADGVPPLHAAMGGWRN
jgi:acetyl/propionyl-CoA carboxylase alpha subunit